MGLGILTDFVVMDRNDAQRVADSSCPSQEFSGLDGQGLDTRMLSELWAIMTGTKADSKFMLNGIAYGGDEGPAVYEVPPGLVELLAKLDAKQHAAITEKWAKTEPFSEWREHWTTDRVAAILGDIAVLCRNAIDRRQSLLLWMACG